MITDELTIAGATMTAPEMNLLSLSMAGGTLTAQSVTTSGDVTVSGGTIVHPATTTSEVFRLEMDIGGAFTMHGGKINLTGRGYQERMSFGPNGPSTALHAGNGSGGSHGGVGTRGAAVYDDYRDPRYPGAGGTTYGGGTDGGGVLIVRAAGLCTMNNDASIEANGTNSDAVCTNPGAGAGGTVNLRCGGFAGTAGPAAITASGGSGGDGGCPVRGGGGRIALVSSGGQTSFSGSFGYRTALATFRSTVRAYGGGNGGGAGTIYLKHRDGLYGDMIVDNGLRTGGVTRLVSMSGTTGPSSGQFLPVSVSSSPALSASFANVYAGMRLRPDLDRVDDTPDDWTDDNVLEVASNDASNLTLTTVPVGTTAGSAFRSIDIFDHLEIGPQASVETNGDIYVVDGSLQSPSRSSLALQNAFLTFTSNGAINASLDLTLSGLTSAVDTLNLGSLRLQSGTLTAREIRTSGDVIITGGTLTHPATTTTTVSTLSLMVGGVFSMVGGTINVTGRGYPSGYSYGPNGPSTALAAAAGSHGGAGDSGAAVYDDYRNPRLPGGGGANGFVGGGVVIVNAVGRCSIENGATIVANGTGSPGYGGGAGGTVNLRCGGFGGSAGAAAITASGAPGHNSGGGRIALVSSGNASSFSGSFDYNANLATLKSRVRAYGGGTGAGAGTIFLKSSNQTHGDLVVDNGGIVIGQTPLLSMSGTTGTPTGTTVPVALSSAPAFSPGFVNLYAGMKVRPDVTVTNGTPDDWTDDNVLTVQSNGVGTLVMTQPFSGVGSGSTLRSIDLLDRIDVSGQAQLTTNGDLYVTTGSLTPSGDGAIAITNGLLLPTSSERINRPMDATLTAGTYSLGSLRLRSLTIDGATVTAPLVTVDAFTMSGGSLTAQQVTTRGDVFIAGGTLTHPPTSTTTVSTLTVTAGGAFSMFGGSVNVTGRGYPSGYSYGPNGPSTALAAAAGSHGGAGDSGAAVYDDYRNPRLPGGGGANGFVGGGVVIVNAVGRCSIENGATIVANGTGSAGYGGGAGGTVNLRCGGFGGSAGAAAITASGAPGHNSGGGRIALVSSGNASSFSGSFDYNANLATLKSRVRAYGGGTGAGAGTIFLKSSNHTHGDLVVDNGGIAGTTPMLDAAANANVVFSNGTTSPSTELRITSAATPFANRVNLFVGQLFDVFPTGNAALRDPRNPDRLRTTMTANGANTFVASGAVFPTINADHEFRMVYVFDHLEVGGRATLAFGTADVVVVPTGGPSSCDLHSGVAGRLEVPTASLVSGNALASGVC